MAVLIGVAIVLVSLCLCAGAVAAVLTWGDDVYRRLTDDRGDTVALGEAGRDGAFEFTVIRIDCGVAQIGDSFINRQSVNDILGERAGVAPRLDAVLGEAQVARHAEDW